MPRLKKRWFLYILPVLAVLPYVVAYFIRVEPARSIQYGVTYIPSYASSLGLDPQATYLGILDDLKVNNLRLAVYWDQVEKWEGGYDFSSVYWQLDEARKRNVKVILAIGRKTPRWPECHDPAWLGEKTEDQINKSLLKLVGAEVNAFRYYDNIEMWQVENEPYFPFGNCPKYSPWTFLNKEVALVRSLDKRPIIIQDSGESGVWMPTFKAGDYLGISMYRRVKENFGLSPIFKHVYFTYPLSYWYYGLKARVVGVPPEKIKVLELQSEPWGDMPLTYLPKDIAYKTMSHEKFVETVGYARASGFNSIYLWGVEWWAYQKEKNNDPFYWDTAKKIWVR